MNFQKAFMMRNSLVVFAVAAVALTACQDVPPPPPPPAAPEILDFHASASQVEKGALVTLSWETKNATSVQLVDSHRGVVSDATEPSGTVSLTVEKDTLFALTVKNERGVTDSAAATVRVTTAPTDILFVATPAVSDAGETVTLGWSAPGASTVTVRPQGGELLDLGGQLVEGFVTVNPVADTTYEINVDGTVRTASVKVRPVVKTFTVDPSSVTPGMPATLSWEAAGATSVTLSVPGGEVLHTQTSEQGLSSGTFDVTIPAGVDPQTAFTWRLTLLGSAPEVVATRDVTAYVAGQPRIVSFVAPEYGLENAKFTASWQTAETDVVRIARDGVEIYESTSSAEAGTYSLELNTPEQTAVYTLTAINHRGGTAQAQVTVSPVGVTQVMQFVASPAGVTNGGDPVTLTWNVPGARRLAIVANGEYTVHSGRGPQAETGSVVVYPNADTTYELVADNTIGDAVSDSEDVTLTTPATSSAAPTMPVADKTNLDVAWTVGGNSQIYGFPHDTVDSRTASTGFQDISTTGTKLAFAVGADDATLNFTPEFETFLYGARAPSRVVVSTNGFLVFGTSAASRSVPEPLPSSAIEKNFVAPFWADLEFGPNTGIYWQVVGEAPERVLVVQWDRIRVFDEPTTELTFQARIHQTGVIDFEYQTVNSGSAAPVIGVQGPHTVYAVQHQGMVAAAQGLTFFGPVASPAPFVARHTGPAVGGFVKIGSGYLKLGFTPAVVPPGSLVITEALFHPAVAVATTGEWVEIYNPTSSPIDLAGYELDFGASGKHTITSANGTTVVPSKGLLVFGQSSNPADTDGVTVQYVYGPTFTMDDTAGTVALNKGATVASLAWSTGLGGEGVAVSADASPALYAVGGSAGTCSATAPFGGQTPQQKGTPGTLSGCYPYSLSSIPGAFEDIKTGGTILLGSASDYDGRGTITLPAPFTYYGQTFTDINISMVGFGTFGPALTSAYNTTNDTTPSTSAPNGVVAPFWDEIVRNTNGEIYMARKTNYTIISWQDFRIYATTSSLNFQMKLFDNGTIEFHYGAITAPTTRTDEAYGSLATIWIEKPDGTSALPIGVNKANAIAPNSGFRFTPL